MNGNTSFGQKKYRRIEFKSPANPTNGFQNGKLPQQSASSSSSGEKQSKNGKDQKGPKATAAVAATVDDGVSGPTPGMFDPSLVLANMHWTSMSRAGPGLFNQGNTCFLNSTLQCLLHTPAFTQILLKEPQAALRGLDRRGEDKGENGQKAILQHYQRYVSHIFTVITNAILFHMN